MLLSEMETLNDVGARKVNSYLGIFTAGDGRYFCIAGYINAHNFGVSIQTRTAVRDQRVVVGDIFVPESSHNFSRIFNVN